MIFVDTRLLTASREFELLDRFQKTERKPLILYESNRLEKTEIDQVLSLSPWFIYTGFQWQQMLESALSFARTFEVSEKDLLNFEPGEGILIIGSEKMNVRIVPASGRKV